ncbi:MAG: Mfa1 family fimbria major subunit [Bacteroidales bacterium]|jgi:hypothetical protein|nr:Mfa1 family fimbria major subunit [Bacteroidales bacterium]
MKKVNFLILALTAFIFFSCSKDDKANDPFIQGQETHSAVSLSFPKTMLKSADEGAANTVEAEVTTVAVYIVDDINGMMHKGVFNNTQFVEQNGKYALTSAIKTTTGDKKIYVVLNPGATLQTNIDNMKGGIFGDIALDGTAANYVTASDLVMASTAAASKTLTVQTEAEALADPLAITVQRNTAKVAVKEKSASTPVIGGSIANLEFAMLVEAKKSYLVQQGGNTLGTVITPGRNISPLTADNDYFTKLSTPSTWKSVNTNSVENKDLAGYYVLENVNVSNVTGNTTAAIIKGQYTPTANTVVVAYAANGTRTIGSISAGESFYVKKSDNTFWSESAYADALNNGLTAGHFSKKYDNGTGYYRIWVQDADGNRGVLRNNYYVLNVTKISGPGLPSVPGVDPEDPNLPIEEDTYISVEVTILPWNVESSDHEL